MALYRREVVSQRKRLLMERALGKAVDNEAEGPVLPWKRTIRRFTFPAVMVDARTWTRCARLKSGAWLW